MFSIGFIVWQAFMVSRAYRLFWAMNRHTSLVEAAPWQVNNTGYLNANIEKKYKDHTEIRRCYCFLFTVVLVTVFIAITLRFKEPIPEDEFNRILNKFRETQPEFDEKGRRNYWMECGVQPWHRYIFLTIWGITLAYIVPSGLFELRGVRDHLSVRLELIAITLISLVAYFGYGYSLIKEWRYPIRWLCGMYIATHTICIFVPLFEVWQRRRLVHQVTNTEFEEILDRNDAVWRAFQRYAARDLCGENICFIESYRKLMAQVKEYKHDLIKAQRKQSRKSLRSSGRELENISDMDCEAPGSATASAYTQRVMNRLRGFTQDSQSSSSDVGANQPTCVASPSTNYDEVAMPSTPPCLPKVTGIATVPTTIKHTSSTSVCSVNDEVNSECESVPTNLISFDASSQLPALLVPAYRAMFETYIHDDATLQLNITHAAKTHVSNCVREYNYTFDMFDAIYAEVKWSLWTNTFPKFIEMYRQDLATSNESIA
jgi:hypothetical protein